MELCYRGVKHSHISEMVEMIETNTKAQFLGQQYQVRRPVYQPYQEKLNLIYRGIAYNTDKTTVSDLKPSKTSVYITQLSQELGH